MALEESGEFYNSSHLWYNKLSENFEGFERNPWIGSVLGAIIVGLSGIFPLLVIPIDGGVDFTSKGAGAEKLKLLLSFAVGGLLGDVFLHLLPEAWNMRTELEGEHPPLNWGLWVLGGLLVFTLLEKVFTERETQLEPSNNNLALPSKQSKQMSGYLNLMANVIDNFSHGLQVGGSFLLSWRVGALSTLAILIHEVPHEVGDFAILLRAGFSRFEAAKAQLATASSSLLGAAAALWCSDTSDLEGIKTSWILPFTAGGFLHIAMVAVLPELLQEQDPRESVKQLISLMLGVSVMAFMTLIFD